MTNPDTLIARLRARKRFSSTDRLRWYMDDVDDADCIEAADTIESLKAAVLTACEAADRNADTIASLRAELAAANADEGWQHISTAPTDESTHFLVLLPGNSMAPFVVVQVSRFEGQMYPDALDANIDWDDRITTATHWRPIDRVAIDQARGA